MVLKGTAMHFPRYGRSILSQSLGVTQPNNLGVNLNTRLALSLHFDQFERKRVVELLLS
jgi:hypothetical protein